MASDFGLKLDEAPHVATDLISSVKPRTSSRSTINTAESDRVAGAAGFTSREPSAAVAVAPYATPRRQKRPPEVRTPLSMSVPRSVHVRFRDFADERNLSYPDALEKLLNDSELLQRLERKV